MQNLTSETPRGMLFKIKRVLAIILMVEMAILVSLSPGEDVLATGNNSPSECNDPDAKVEDNEGLMSFTAPTGNTITGVCIKSGNNMFNGDEHGGLFGNGTYENGCYTVSGVNTGTVTVQRTADSSTCQGLSHIDIFFSPESSPSPTPTPSPTSEITPTPIPSPSPCNGICNNTGSPSPTPEITPTPIPSPSPCNGICNNTGSPSPTPTSTPESTPTPSPTPTPTTTPTPTPTPETSPTTTTTTTTTTSGGGGTAVAGASAENNPGPTPTPEAAVLGVSAQLPETGAATTWLLLALLSMLSGSYFTFLGLKKN